WSVCGAGSVGLLFCGDESAVPLLCGAGSAFSEVGVFSFWAAGVVLLWGALVVCGLCAAAGSCRCAGSFGRLASVRFRSGSAGGSRVAGSGAVLEERPGRPSAWSPGSG